MDGRIYIERVDVGAFGTLAAKSVSFTDGVNLIKAPNESGKSTLAAAIRFALYGFKGRTAAITDNPKKMYLPWSGAAASVAVTLGGDRRLRIERSFKGAKEQAVCTDLATGRSLFAGLCFGEEIFGLSAETFEKTLFFSTLEPPESKDEGLASALQNLLFSADEQIGAEKAAKVLTAHKNALKGRTSGSGEIARLELDEQRLEEKLRGEKGVMREINELEAAYSAAESAYAERAESARRLEAERLNCEKYRAASALAEYGALKEKAERAKNDLQNAPFADLSLEDIEKLRAARDEKRRAEERLEEVRRHAAETGEEKEPTIPDEGGLTSAFKKHKRLTAAFSVLLPLGLLVCALGAALLGFMTQKTAAFAVLGLGVLAVAAAFAARAAARIAVKKAGFASFAKLAAAIDALPALRAERAAFESRAESARIRIKQAEAEYESARRAYAALAPTENDEAVDAMYAGYVLASRLRAFKQAADDAVAGFEARNDTKELAALAEGAVKPLRPREQIETEYRFAAQSAAGLKDKLNDLKSRIEVLKAGGSDPSATESRLLWTRAELEERRLDYEALTVALEELQAANDEMRSSISPRIAALAGDLFAAATGGRYGALELDTRLYLSFESAFGLKSAEHLSAGTREAVYLCLRLAVIKLIYGESKVPIVLDDAFAHTDDERVRNIVKLFCDSGNQIIMAGCTDREERALDRVGAEYGRVAL